MGSVRVDRSGLRKLSRALAETSSKGVTVGWFESARYADNTPVAGIAAQNEYGNPGIGIPARPFMRPAIDANQKDWDRLLAKGFESVLDGKSTAVKVFNMLGLKVSADIKNSISGFSGTPLKEATVKARMRKKADGKTVGNLTKPLVEEAIMLNTVTYEVSD